MKHRKLQPLTLGMIDHLLGMAWSDRDSFESIEKKTGYNEAAVIVCMRYHLKPKSFRRWRKRVSGRSTKHQVKLRQAGKL